MRAPGFWQSRSALAGRALAPFGWLYAAAGAMRRRLARPERAPVPVLCVGNLTAGGAGKTPVVAALAARLSARGVGAHVVTRGYGGTERGPHRVDLRVDRAGRVGDEALLLAAHAPVWVARDRAAGARAAAAAGAGAVILDDGFQNPGLFKDVSVVVVDGPAGFGSGRLIPAGPLREPVSAGLSRADAVIVMGAGDLVPGGFGGPVLRARLAPVFTGVSLTGARVVAFAGIGRPEKFFETLRGMGAIVVEGIPFADHARYDGRILNRLLRRAQDAGAMLVCTDKDAVKLPPAFLGRIKPIPVRVDFADDVAVEALLDGLMSSDKKRHSEL